MSKTNIDNNKSRKQYSRKSLAISIMASLALVAFISSIGNSDDPHSKASAATWPDYYFSTVGDWGCNSNTQNTVNGIVNKNPNLVLAAGDFSYQSTADCWFQQIQPIDSVTKIAIGNHETTSSTLLQQYMNHFSLTSQYYSFDKQNIHFLIMSTEQSYASGSAQYNFVINDLQKASANTNINWIIVVLHKEAYTSPNTIDQPRPAIYNTYHPLFDKYHVDLVLQGHNHNYQRTYPITYNSANSASPTVTSTDPSSYANPNGEIWTIVGTGGISLFSLSSKASFVSSQYVGYGFLNVGIINGGNTLDATFYANPGSPSFSDHFTITKSTTTTITPTVTSTSPTDGATGVSTSTTIKATFSTDVNGVDSNSFTIKDSAGNSVQGTVTYDSTSKTATFTPSSSLQPSTKYTASLSSAITDQSGNALTPFSWSFTTAGISKYNYAPSFAATGSNFKDVSSTSSLQLSRFSVAAWFTTTKSYSSKSFIVNKGGDGVETAGQNQNYGIWMTNGGAIQAGFETTSGADNYAVSSTSSYNDGQWHYAVVTYDGSTVKLYIDGSQIATKSTSATPDNTGTQPLRIGANSRVLSGYFTGNIDEVRVWNRAVTATEVSNQYSSGSFDTTGQVAYLPFS